jgi:dTDP-4-amino-4,6-dideoxygalactose transaminase
MRVVEMAGEESGAEVSLDTQERKFRMKIARPSARLAIEGAPPAFSQPVHVGRPNIGAREVFLRMTHEMFERRWLTNDGPLVRRLEAEVASYLGVKHCVAMCNGTVALEIAIRALNLTGEVIVPSYTFIATAHALHWQGITPVFADIDATTHNLNPVAVRRMITPKTSGIIGVHLWGRPAPAYELQELADEFGLALMFDAAHAFGCSYRGKRIGGLGRAEVLSFHATKFFNTFEGGAVVTNDDVLAEKMRLMRNFGFAGYDNVVHPGTNGKMIEVCAAMGLANLEILEQVVQGNKRNYLAYRDAFQGSDRISIIPYDEAEENNYQYVVIEIEGGVELRDSIVGGLHAENILARKYFWPGCHRMKPYRDLFPHAGLVLQESERVASRAIVLPTGTSVSIDDVKIIADIVLTLAHS